MAKRRKTKRERKNNLKKIEGVGGFDPDIWSKFFVVLIVLVVLGLFYLLTIYITNKNSDSKESTDDKKTEATISYENIVLGKSFSMDEDDYLVIYYDKSDKENSSKYSSLVSTYKSKEEHLKIYTVDMGSAFNKKYATDGEAKRDAGNASELSIHGPTLIHFTNHSISDYIEGEEDINSYLS